VITVTFSSHRPFSAAATLTFSVSTITSATSKLPPASMTRPLVTAMTLAIGGTCVERRAIHHKQRLR